MLTLGKTYRIGSKGSTSALALPFDGELCLVRWSKRGWQQVPLNNAVTYATEPSLEEVLAEWGCPVSELDDMIEREWYSRTGECQRVRAIPSRRVSD